MSTKSKRRIARRHESTEAVPTSKRQVAGEIVGALLGAITFGALDGPQSARAPQSTPTPATDGPQPA